MDSSHHRTRWVVQNQGTPKSSSSSSSAKRLNCHTVFLDEPLKMSFCWLLLHIPSIPLYIPTISLNLLRIYPVRLDLSPLPHNPYISSSYCQLNSQTLTSKAPFYFVYSQLFYLCLFNSPKSTVVTVNCT